MKIVFLDAKTLGKDIDLSSFNSLGEVTIYETTKPEEILIRVQDCDVVITNKVVIDKDIMENSKIQLICVAATGTNNIDLNYAKKKGIVVKNVAGYSTASVAQVTISIVFHFIQKLNYYIEYVNKKEWEESDIFTHIDEPFYELENKTWGIIGLGTIGLKVANIAKSFGCKVIYHSTSGMNNNTDFEQTSLKELLKKSDIVSIHSPLNETTYNLINKTNISSLKDGAILINVGRGGIINEEDLANRLDEDKPLYCGLDVLESEPINKNNPLNYIQKKERLIITPHIAWGSVESRKRLVNKIFDNIQSFVL